MSSLAESARGVPGRIATQARAHSCRVDDSGSIQLRNDRVEVVDLHRLDQVRVEARLGAALAILILSIAPAR